MDHDGDVIDILKMRLRDCNAPKDRTLAGKLGDEYLQYCRVNNRRPDFKLSNLKSQHNRCSVVVWEIGYNEPGCELAG